MSSFQHLKPQSNITWMIDMLTPNRQSSLCDRYPLAYLSTDYHPTFINTPHELQAECLIFQI